MARASRNRAVRPGLHRPRRLASALCSAVLLAAAGAVVGYKFHLFDRLWPTRRAALPTVRIGEHLFKVDLANDEPSRSAGLSRRVNLAADEGMLFIYPAEQPAEELAFWMKDCLIDLDVAFISGDRRIVTIHTMKAEPANKPAAYLPRYRPTAAAQFALEVGAGQFARRGITVGDRVELSAAAEAATRSAR